MEIYQAHFTLMEHTFWASRELGDFYETEPLIGNYALAYALGLCAAPYQWSGPPRYREDLAPLNQQEIYLTPGYFFPDKLRFAVSRFNSLSDSYYFRFDQNAVATDRTKARAANFPQGGRYRMLGQGSEGIFFLLSGKSLTFPLPDYIRLGKFNSKARLQWQKVALQGSQPVEMTKAEAITGNLNGADLAPATLAGLQSYSVFNIYPAPVLSNCRVSGLLWQFKADQQTGYLPANMKFGVEDL